MTNHINAVLYYGTGKIKLHRMTLIERFRLWKRRRVIDDLVVVR